MARRVLIIGSNQVLAWQLQLELRRRNMQTQIIIRDRLLASMTFDQLPDSIILICDNHEKCESKKLYEQLKCNTITASIPVFIVTNQVDEVSPGITHLKNGDYQLPNNAFVAYTLVDLMHFTQTL